MAKVIGRSSGYLLNQSLRLKVFALLIPLGVLVILLLAIEYLPLSTVTGILAFLIAVGIFFTVVAPVLEKRQDQLISKSKRFMGGHSGENIAEEALSGLPDSYLVFRDVRLGGKGNIDFVVVGPNGVFVVEVKNHAGAIGFDGSVLTRNGRPVQEKNLLMQAMNQSFQLRDYLTKRVGYQVFIAPILVFTHQYAKVRFGLTPIKGVTVVRKESVQQAIVGVKGTMNPDLMAKIVEALQETVTR